MAPDAAGRAAPAVSRWRVLEAARLRRVERVPFAIGARVVGSVARSHLGALGRWPDWLAIGQGPGAGVAMTVAAAGRDEAFAAINQVLRAEGLVRAWRDELFALPDPATGARLATIERASARFWGTLTLGAHATGYVRGPGGKPEALWIARRSFTKATDPGLLDNLVGGGVPDGQSPREALVREGFEEAGLVPAQMAAASAASVLRLERDIPEGLQHEWLHSFDLDMPASLTPQNQDGEVDSFRRVPMQEAIELAAGDAMTVDAALVTLDFLLRHGWVEARDPAHAHIRAFRISAAGRG